MLCFQLPESLSRRSANGFGESELTNDNNIPRLLFFILLFFIRLFFIRLFFIRLFFILCTEHDMAIHVLYRSNARASNVSF